MRYHCDTEKIFQLCARFALSAGFVAGVCLLTATTLAAQPIVAKFVSAPNVPPPITRTEPAHVIINLATEEKVGELSEGVQVRVLDLQREDTRPVHPTAPGRHLRGAAGQLQGQAYAHRGLSRRYRSGRRRQTH